MALQSLLQTSLSLFSLRLFPYILGPIFHIHVFSFCKHRLSFDLIDRKPDQIVKAISTTEQASRKWMTVRSMNLLATFSSYPKENREQWSVEDLSYSYCTQRTKNRSGTATTGRSSLISAERQSKSARTLVRPSDQRMHLMN